MSKEGTKHTKKLNRDTTNIYDTICEGMALDKKFSPNLDLVKGPTLFIFLGIKELRSTNRPAAQADWCQPWSKRAWHAPTRLTSRQLTI